jgi:hypothetical protein
MAERDDLLESFFDAGRAGAERPDAALLARIEADALAALDARARPRAPSTGGGWRGIFEMLGGWRAGAGLAGAALAGIVLGASLPTAITGLGTTTTTDDAGYELGDLAPGYGLSAMLEG